MDLTFNILLIVHLTSLVVGASTTIALPVVAGRLAPLPEGRPLLAGIGKRLALNSRIAFGVLILSGIGMVAVRYGGVEGMSGWFWAKIGLVAVMVVAMIVGAVARPGQVSPRVLGWVTRLSLLGIVVAAVFAFN